MKPDLDKPIAFVGITTSRHSAQAKVIDRDAGDEQTEASVDSPALPAQTERVGGDERKSTGALKKALSTKVKLKAPYPSPDGNGTSDKISLQYAVKEVVQQAGLRYDFNTSFRNTDPLCRRWVTPRIQNKTCGKALQEILDPFGLTYKIEDGAVVLEKK